MDGTIKRLLLAFSDPTLHKDQLPSSPVERDRGLRLLFGEERWLDATTAALRAPVLGVSPLHDALPDLVTRAGALLSWACRNRICVVDAEEQSWTLLETDVVFVSRSRNEWVDLRAARGLERTIVAMARRERRERARLEQREHEFAARLIAVLADRIDPHGELPNELRETSRPMVHTWGAFAELHRQASPPMPLWNRHRTLRDVIEIVRARERDDLADLADFRL